MFVSFQDFCWQKQGTFLFEAWPDSAEKGDILNTGKFGFVRKFEIGNLFIGELFITGERTFETVKFLWKGGKGKIGKLKIY